MKKLLITAILTTLTLTSTVSAFATDIKIDNNKLSFTAESGIPFVDESNRTQVPFRIAMENFGANVSWDQVRNTAIAEKNGIKVEVPIGQNHIVKDGVEIKTDTAALIKEGRTYLPIRAVVEAFGANVSWDADTQTVNVSTTGETQITSNPTSSKKITVLNIEGDLIEVGISKDKAIEIAKQKQREYFGIEVPNDIEVTVELNGGYSILKPTWVVVMYKKDKLYLNSFIDANTGILDSASYKYFNAQASKGNKLSIEDAKRGALKFLVDKKIINSNADVKFVGKSSEYIAKTGIGVDFVSVNDENQVYSIALDHASKQVSLFSNYKKRTAEEQKQLDEYNASHKK